MYLSILVSVHHPLRIHVRQHSEIYVNSLNKGLVDAAQTFINVRIYSTIQKEIKLGPYRKYFRQVYAHSLARYVHTTLSVQIIVINTLIFNSPIY